MTRIMGDLVVALSVDICHADAVTCVCVGTFCESRQALIVAWESWGIVRVEPKMPHNQGKSLPICDHVHPALQPSR